METVESTLPLMAVLVSLVAAVLILLARRRPNLRESFTLLAALTKLGLVLALMPDVLDGLQPEIRLFALSPGIELAFRVDGPGLLFALFASVLWLLASLYSIGYVRTLDEHKQTRYFASFAVCMSATIGLAFSANLITFFVCYELLTAATYPLVVHKESPEALAAGRRYLAYLLTGGAALLLAMAVSYTAAGTLEFTPGGFLAGTMGTSGLVAVAALFFLGFGSKAAVMPLHAWLPSAMVAPTPVSSLLHAVAVVKAGIFGFVRAIGYVMGLDTLADLGLTTVLSILAATTIVVASIIALRQDNLKRRLAFSTVAHLSYIVLGLSLVSAEAWNGALLHMVNHAALKITLFFCAGAIYVKTKCDKVSQLDGIGRQMPVTMAAFTVASLGLAGVPPIGGFVSKWFLALGAAEAHQAVFAAILLGSGLFTAGYLFPIVYRAFFLGSERFATLDEASPFMVGPLATTALLAVLLGMGDVFGIHALTSEVGALIGGGAR